ncbi:putative multidrug resistant protein [Rosellinia necatrix]|uniref:Putative multidrug resistant protein n=1 Tax=Rosellinia necatrix TaxID=77044 RepID=A0A1W2TK93_ROSNE|nr:putative multidrug resistant protein [Rosellinia necatrix]
MADASSSTLKPEATSPLVRDPEKQTPHRVCTEDEDAEQQYIVGWEQPETSDPENPLNWPIWQKWSIIGVLTFLSFLVPLASSALAPGVPKILAEFHTDHQSLATFVVSVFVLGFAFGPLVIAPLGELYGRTVIYHVCNVLFVIFTVACALSTSIGMLIAFRFLAGFTGVAVLTNGSGTIIDLLPRDQRGRAISLWSGGSLIGPIIGPIFGGVLAESVSWRWVFWITAIAYGVGTIASFMVLRETYAPRILEQKAARWRKDTGNPRYQSRFANKGSARQLLISAIARPARMFVFSPIVAITSLYIAFLYGVVYIIFTTFTFVFEDIYAFNARSAGFVFIAGGVGNIIGQAFTGIYSDKVVKRNLAQGKEPRPEDRLDLVMTIPFALAPPVGIILYGWTTRSSIHWIVPLISTGIVGFGTLGLFTTTLTYLVEAFEQHAASVTAANTVWRSILGAVLPLFGLQLYDHLGLGWGNTLLGLALLALAPVLWVLHKFGARIRLNPKYQRRF